VLDWQNVQSSIKSGHIEKISGATVPSARVCLLYLFAHFFFFFFSLSVHSDFTLLSISQISLVLFLYAHFLRRLMLTLSHFTLWNLTILSTTCP
jgi:hypothetical protein